MSNTRSPRSKRRNIVLTLADDQNPYALGFLGQNLCETPALDKLAAQGCICAFHCETCTGSTS